VSRPAGEFFGIGQDALYEVFAAAEAARAAMGTPEAEETMRRLLLEIRMQRHSLEDWADHYGVVSQGRDIASLVEDRKRGRWWLDQFRS
jgi:hypothetical protein